LVAARGGLVQFYGNAKAGNATITNQGASGYGIGSGSTGLLGNSSAENATFINNGGTTGFADNATAANATLIANAADNGIPAGAIAFYGDSSGGTSQIKVYGDGLLEVSVHNAPGLTVGSIEGTGNIFLGSRNLTVGSNNRTIDFLGMIQEGGGRLPGGTLTKIGTGELALQGACTFPGLTTVNAGVLNVDGSLTGPVTVNGGKLVGFGSVGPVTINRGGRLSPGEDVGVLKVQGNLMMAPGSTYEAVLFGPTAGTTYNQANVAGKVNLSGSTLVVRLEYFPTPGTSYTIIKNDGKDAIKGKFQGKAKFTVDGLKFKISYKGGDGNDVVLTALR
jgi:autotransporter-associated beta strand protein